MAEMMRGYIDKALENKPAMNVTENKSGFSQTSNSEMVRTLSRIEEPRSPFRCYIRIYQLAKRQLHDERELQLTRTVV